MSRFLRIKQIQYQRVHPSGRRPDIAAAYLSHANAYVTKPADLDAFSAAIATLDAFFLGTATLPPRTAD